MRLLPLQTRSLLSKRIKLNTERKVVTELKRASDSLFSLGKAEIYKEEKDVLTTKRPSDICDGDLC